MQAILGPILFDGTDAVDARYTIEEDGIRGIFGGSGVRRKRLERPGQHGEFAMPGFREGALYRLRGNVFSDGGHEQEKDLALLSSVIGVGEFEQVTFVSAVGARRATVGLVDAPDISIDVYGSIARYQLQLYAPDPRLYGEPNTFPGSSVEVFQYGNFPAWPTVEVQGPRTAPYSVTGPEGRMVTVTQSLTSGQSHRIDFASGGLYLNGVRQQGKLLRFQPWTIPPQRAVPMSIDQGSMTVTVTDTYI